MADLGRLEPVSIREQWANETQDFTPWLVEADNLQLLADTLGIPLEAVGREQSVGPFSADLVCVEGGSSDDRRVVIENQFGRSDHDHLGKLLTYVAGLGAFSAVWIAERFTEEHQAAVDWLNEHSDASKSFWALEIELWRIGDSAVAPKFNVVSEPNLVTKAGNAALEELSETRRDRLDFWLAFHEHAAERSESVSVSKARPETWVNHSVGRAGIRFSLVYSNYDLAEQRFTGDSMTDDVVSRVELVLDGPRAFSRFAALEKQRDSIPSDVLGSQLVWYSIPAKERKLFVQRIWARDDSYSRVAVFDWLLDVLEAMRAGLLGRVSDA